MERLWRSAAQDGFPLRPSGPTTVPEGLPGETGDGHPVRRWGVAAPLVVLAFAVPRVGVPLLLVALLVTATRWWWRNRPVYPPR